MFRIGNVRFAAHNVIYWIRSCLHELVRMLGNIIWFANLGEREK